jgi:3,4-dihydroxy 2-butanone 4-phosphate synthase/GTP cyclohydrolase II
MEGAPGTRGITSALQSLRLGGLVLVTDSERPERGGIVVAAAERTNDDLVNFMATYARGGLICLALTAERAERLGLEPIGHVDGLAREDYLVSIEARHGVTTGISAADRARTIQVAADPASGPDDLATPGHIFPARAQPRGVVSRPGWTEAALDLARLAGMAPAATFCQVLDADGEILVGEGLAGFAAERGLGQTTIGEIVLLRTRSECFVTLLTQSLVPTAHGDFVARVFLNQLDGKQHVALTLGELRTGGPALVRLHSECLTGDVFGSLRCDCGPQLDLALERIAAEGRGVLLYLRQEGRGIGIANKIRAYALQDRGRDTVEANLELGFPADKRDYGLGAQMLMALGVSRVRLLTNNPRKVDELTAFGLQVVDRIGLEVEPGPINRPYLETKKLKLGHFLTKV